MFVTHSSIVVPEGEQEALEQAFRARLRAVDGHAGFVGLELLRDYRKRGRYLLVTRWSDRGSFLRYMKSGDYKAAHERQHEGLSVTESENPDLQQFEAVEL